MPNVFSSQISASDSSSILTEKLKVLTPVALPRQVLKQQEHERMLEINRSPLKGSSSTRALDPIPEHPSMGGLKRGSMSVGRRMAKTD